MSKPFHLRFSLLLLFSVLMISVGIIVPLVFRHHDITIQNVSFDIPYEMLEQTYRTDIDLQSQGKKVSWIELLSCLSENYQGDLSRYRQEDLDDLKSELCSGKNVRELVHDKEQYSCYLKLYETVLGGFVGDVERQQEDYGLKVFSPLPKGFPYTHYDDFGAERTYGYRRSHLGHDLICQSGTPVTAIESGTVEALGWNQYGGWRIGIRSFDKKRYYYYAHLQKDRPFQSGLSIGKVVCAGDVIGYTGQTGYSRTENESNIEIPHLHIGLSISPDDSSEEIWVDLYGITRFLEQHRAEVFYDLQTKEFHSAAPSSDTS